MANQSIGSASMILGVDSAPLEKGMADAQAGLIPFSEGIQAALNKAFDTKNAGVSLSSISKVAPPKIDTKAVYDLAKVTPPKIDTKAVYDLAPDTSKVAQAFQVVPIEAKKASSGVMAAFSQVQSFFGGMKEGIISSFGSLATGALAACANILPGCGLIVTGLVGLFGGMAAGIVSLLGKDFADILNPSTWLSRAQSVFDEITAVTKQASKAGVSSSVFQGLMAGTRLDSDQLTNVLTRIQKEVGNLTLGNKQAEQSFAGLGLSAANFQGKDTAESFRLIAQRIKDIPDANQQAAEAFKIFGKAYKDVLPALRTDIDQTIAKLNDMGFIVSDSDAASMRDLGKTWKEISLMGQSVWRQFAAAVVPLFKNWADTILESWKIIQPYLMIGVQWIKGFADGASSIISGLAAEIKPMLADMFGGVGKQAMSWQEVSKEVVEFSRSATLSFAEMFNQIMPMAANLVKSIGTGLLSGVKIIQDTLPLIVDGFVAMSKGVLSSLQTLTGPLAILDPTGVSARLNTAINSSIAGLDGLKGASDAFAKTDLSPFQKQIDDAAKSIGQQAIDPSKINTFFDGVLSRIAQVKPALQQALNDGLNPEQLQKAFDLNKKFENPIAKFQETFNELSLLFSKGAINSDVLQQGIEEAMKTAESALGVKAPQLAKAMGIGSNDATNLIYQATLGNSGRQDPQQRMNNLLTTANQWQQRIATASEQTRDLIRNQPRLGVI